VGIDQNKYLKELKKKYNYRFYGIIIVLLGIVALVTIASISYGTSDISYKEILDSFFSYDENNTNHIIIREARLPRIVASMISGIALSASGAIMQVLTRNPLASPSTLGVTSGSNLAFTIVFIFFPSLSIGALTLASITGAFLSAGIIFLIVYLTKGRISPSMLILAGVSLGAIQSSLGSFIGYFKGVTQDITAWYAAGFSRVSWEQLNIVVPIVIIGVIGAYLLSKSLTIMVLGDQMAKGLGKNTLFIKILGLIIIVVLTGSVASIGGTLMFVGLIVPHIVRAIIGADYRKVLPLSMIAGGTFLVLMDYLSRIVNSPYEFPVGALTSAVGAPVFIYIIRKKRKI